MRNHRRLRRIEGTVGKAFVMCMIIFFLLNLIVSDKEMSEEENRMLAGSPRLSWSSLVSGDFMTKYETYLADQFAGRNFWRSIKVGLSGLGGSRQEEDILIGKDDYLMEEIVSPDQDTLMENLEAIRQFAKRSRDIQTYMLLVPNAANIMRDRLPAFATVSDQSRMFAQVKRELGEDVEWLDAAEALKKHAGEQIYYKTDHHWTSRGAAYGFNAAAKQLEIEGVVSDYKIHTVATDFSGTLASRSGYHKVKDTVEVYQPENVEYQYLVSDSDNEEKRPTIYDRKALEGKDKYQVFFGGNHAMVDIVTTNDNQRRLLVFKDSYANSFVPFLIPYYNEIIMIDARYYYENVNMLIENKGITDVLFLYNMDTFLNDNSLGDVLAGE